MCTRMSLEEIEDLGLPDEGSLEVAMDHIEVLHLNQEDMEDSGSLLHTVGLGPCIAFIAKGTVERKNKEEEENEDDGPGFIALYHWSGDSLASDSQEKNKETYYLRKTQEALSLFLASISQEIGNDHTISLEALHFIGGQKNSSKPDDKTGTEEQVRAIQKLIDKLIDNDSANINQTAITIKKTCEISMHFFEATEEESIDVFMNYDNIAYVVYETVYANLILPASPKANKSNKPVQQPILSDFFPASPKKHSRKITDGEFEEPAHKRARNSDFIAAPCLPQ